MSLADDLHAERFSPGHGDPRSRMYADGYLAGLRDRLDGTRGLTNPYRQGTAEADAWWSGRGHGEAYARFVQEEASADAAKALYGRLPDGQHRLPAVLSGAAMGL